MYRYLLIYIVINELCLITYICNEFYLTFHLNYNLYLGI